MSDVVSWLTGLGLAAYAKVFADNAVDEDVLPDLTDADLQQLGIPLGHRKKLLKAIEALKIGNDAPAAGVTLARGQPRTIPSVDQAERRQLTVMFVDLVGSTELSLKLDPEELRELSRAYQDATAREVSRYGGHVAKYMGDGVLVYFGYPQAHEDDAVRAIHAGLAVARAVKQLGKQVLSAHGGRLQARLGVATGVVVVGDLVGSEGFEEGAVTGETPNLAFRLQSLARPDEIVVADRTRALAGDAFTYETPEEQRLKGFPEPVRLWRVLGPSRVESRFEALHSRELTPLVGREHELALLIARWCQAKDGEGQVVLVSGEAGIGKSRIIEVLREKAMAEEHLRIHLQCSPYHMNSALHPVIEHLERAAGFEREDGPEAKLNKLEATLGQASVSLSDAVPLIAGLLSLPTGSRYPPLAMSPEQQKERTLAALTGQVIGLAGQRPVLMIIEDAHWIDPTTAELVDLMVGQAENARLLVVVTARPEYRPAWLGRPNATMVALNRLSKRQGTEMVEGVTGGRALPPEVLDQVVAKTDGVPLFVEELTRMVVESGLLREEAGRYVLTGPLPPLAIPATLHDSLMARLDRLSPAKEVAQASAAIGRTFRHDLLAAVLTRGDADLKAALNQLMDAGLVFRQGVGADAAYTFKHALVQDAAYGSMLKSRRQQLHFKIAKTLEENFPQTVDTAPELIAHHFTEAGLVEPSIAYWKKAGDAAAARSANVEAIAHLKRGLELVRNLPDTADRAEQELMLLNTMAAPLMNTKGYAAPEVVEVFDRAHQLCQRVGNSVHIFQVLAGVSTYHMVQGKVSHSLALAEEMVELAERQNELGPIMEAHRLMGVASLFAGFFPKSVRHFQQVQDKFDPEHRQRWALTYGQDHLMSSFGLGCRAVAALGYPDQAHAWRQRAILEARKSRHYFSLAYAQSAGLSLLYILDEAEMIKESASEVIEFSAAHGFPFYTTHAQIIEGWAFTRCGDLEEGIVQMRQGIEGIRGTGSLLIMPFFFVLLADGLGRSAQFEEGLKLIEKSLDQIERWGERESEAAAYRVKAKLLLSRDASDQDEAERAYWKAIEVARRQESKMWELRAATGLACLWRDQGKKSEARALLSEVYGWFTEGFNVPALREANQTLNTLH